uniref:CW-type domain-containing protein n=4 Tax=Parascaris univalens TaxID=6257 RepID=A0A914ZW42_PARUN
IDIDDDDDDDDDEEFGELECSLELSLFVHWTGMNPINYSILNCASIDVEYLHTNSTTHEFLFGAIAELVDNSRDARADTLRIDYGNGQLSFLDDGCGMDKKEVESVISFGYSAKRMDPEMVGQYGNGLKSAAMRIGKNMLLLTKKEGLLTCMLISRSFLEDNNLKKVIVPTPSFLEDGTPFYETSDEMEKHTLETKIVYEYSPFSSLDQLLVQFRRIEGSSGTLVICYNLRRIEGGDFEMDFHSDPLDVRLTGHIPHREEERNSLRAYLAILYANPRMRVFLRGEKVDTKRILSSLYRPRMYRYQAKNLKACAQRELQECQKKVVELNDLVARNKSEVADFEVRHPNFMRDVTLRIHYRSLVGAVESASEMLFMSENRLKKLVRSKSNPSPLLFYFGLNIQHRNRYGCMVYNNGRLIRMYEKVSNQKEKNDRMLKYLGVVAVVDVPCSVLAPAHSKQCFENPREYANLLKAINDHMEQYWNDTAIAATPGGVSNFWRPFGYESMEWNAEPSNEPEFTRKRYSTVGYSVQCDICLKWRYLQFQQSYLTKGVPKNWSCNMNPNSLFRSCAKLEELPKIPEGRLLRLPDKPPKLSCKQDKDASSLSPKIRNWRMAAAHKSTPTQSPPASERKAGMRSAQLRSHSLEAESSVGGELKSRMPTRKVALKKPMEAVASRKPIERQTARIVTTSNKTLTRGQRTASSQHPVETNRSQIGELSSEDDDDSEDEPAPKRRSLSRAKASRDNGSATRKISRAQQERELSQPTALEKNTDKVSDQQFHKIEEKMREIRKTRSVVLSESTRKIAAVDNQMGSAPQSEQTIAEEVIESDSKMDKLLHKLNEVLEFFRESSFPKLHFADVDDALRFDLSEYFAASRHGLDVLIDEQVAKKVQKYLSSAVKVMKWADPEVEEEITEKNVLVKLDEFAKLI